MKQISHFVKFISVRVCVFWKENADEKSTIFITSIFVCVCVFQKNARIKIQTFWNETSKPLCKIHICACVRVLKTNMDEKSAIFLTSISVQPVCKIHICACVRVLKKNTDENSDISVRVCVFWKKKYGLKFRHICACVRVFEKKKNTWWKFWNEKLTIFKNSDLCVCASFEKNTDEKWASLISVRVCVCFEKKPQKKQTFNMLKFGSQCSIRLKSMMPFPQNVICLSSMSFYGEWRVYYTSITL